MQESSVTLQSIQRAASLLESWLIKRPHSPAVTWILRRDVKCS
ncbi:MAG: hypothetical protein M2R45_01879 [Verrucomicrobia subdivision 3 bacterium]|nr:hypothetical protein [Limisphaerales bacterium]MCS1415679.1 hypothetical protein [Limisphaerales bacterium]